MTSPAAPLTPLRAFYTAEFNTLVGDLEGNLAPGEAPTGPVRVPSQATSDFVSNQARGVWAEQFIADLVKDQCHGFFTTAHGENNTLIAGEPGFERHYRAYHEDLLRIGKRCDLLLYPDGSPVPSPDSLQDDHVRMALAGLEIRSSSQMVDRYYAARVGEVVPASKRNCLSFTPKVEDLHHINRWVQLYGVPHYYIQVFRDKVYAIATIDILRILSDEDNHKTKYWVEKHHKNRFKSTVHVDIACGHHIATIVQSPEMRPHSRVLPRGRVIDYCEHIGGRGTLHTYSFEQALAPALDTLLLARAA